MPQADSIAAIATAPGRGGIGIVRVSGKDLQPFATNMLGKQPVPRVASLASFRDAQGNVLDQGVAIYFPAPHSYTGEDVLELQGHGGPAILQLVLQRCLELGARLAQPGEFTLRAFLNGKLDLVQAESVADLIDAATGQAARSAVRSLQGEFSSVVHQMVDDLIQLRVQIEAALDFPEEVAEMGAQEASLTALGEKLDAALSRAQQGSLLREGAHIVLAGRPNVGKSSLINRLSGEEVALVSDVPGTTRDAIRQVIQINGVPLHIMDTAGLRESQDSIEQMGMARTRDALRKADAVLVLLDAAQGITPEDQNILQELPPEIPRLRVFNKADLLGSRASWPTEQGIHLSAKTGEGVEQLQQELLALLGWHDDQGAFLARERHIQALLSAQESLRLAKNEINRPEILAEALRQAQEAMNQITGEFAPDDLLGEIFSRFCLGK
ncbi:MAG: tRNA uridine-5-carboxymethylaminomethyl(34) synthesis GTPase MnmE [Gallionellaceae bacterium]|nr:tRNA uridine-5-carboxymethylaminomethyl(34) synthesis GTPase MnmE [Gallionellaceae bacterium]